MAPLLAVEELRTSYPSAGGRRPVVDGVSFEVEQGQTLGVIGESGCGKTQTALSIMRLVDPPGRIEEGSRVLFDGRDLVSLPERELRRLRGRDLTMVFQEPMTCLNPLLRVGRQVAEPLRAHRTERRRRAAGLAVDMLSQVEMASPAERARAFPHQLSGGMRQRAMIAMALVGHPRLLIADEPTTALDATVQVQIVELLAELRDRFGMAVLLITHDFGVVAELADTVAVMYGGRIVETGSARAVLADPRHPYTQALIRSIPRLGADRSRPLPSIAGSVVSPDAWPPGCRFAARCPLADRRCAEEYPPTFIYHGHGAACWRVPGGGQDG